MIDWCPPPPPSRTAIRAWEERVPLRARDPLLSGAPRGRGARQPAAHAVPARPRPDRPLQVLPPAQAQDPGLRRPRGRPLPDPAHPHARGLRDRPHRRPGAGAERGPDRGDRARPRPRPPALRPRRRGGARRGAARALRQRLQAQRALAAGGRGAGARRPRPQPDRAGARRHPQPHRRATKPATLEGRIVKLVDRVAYINHDIDDALRAGILRSEDLPAAEIELLGPTGSAADRHPRPRHRRALRGRRGHRPGRGDRRRDAAAAQVHVRPRLPRPAARSASTSGSSGRCAASSTTTWSTRRRCPSCDPGAERLPARRRLHRRDDRPLLHRQVHRADDPRGGALLDGADLAREPGAGQAGGRHRRGRLRPHRPAPPGRPLGRPLPLPRGAHAVVLGRCRRRSSTTASAVGSAAT